MKKYNEDFTTLPTDIVDKITEAVKELDCVPILISRLTNHPDDNRLFIVIAQYTEPHPMYDKAYCVWEANTFSNKASLSCGYYGVSFLTAIQIVARKVRDLNKEEV